MYNSQNLPLSTKKIIKKTLPTIFPALILFSFLEVIIIIFAKTLGSDFGNDAVALFSVYLPIILPALWITISAGAIGYEYFYYKLYYYNFENSSAEIKKGVVAVSTGIVRYNRIQNLYVDQDFLDRVLGLYDVHYETAGETSSFYSHVDGLDKKNSDKLLDFLKERIGNPDTGKEEKSNIAENSDDVQKDDGTVLFSRENIILSKKYLFTSAIFNAEILIFLAILFSSFIIRATKELMPINWSYVLLSLPPIFIVMMIYSWFWFKLFYFEFKAKSIQVKKGVISRSSQFIYYNRIQNINVDQSFLNRLLGICYLNVETAGEGSATFQIPGLKVDDASKLRNFLMEKSQKHQTI